MQLQQFGPITGDASATVMAALASGEPIVNDRWQPIYCGQSIVISDVPTYLRGGVYTFAPGCGFLFNHTAPVETDIDDIDIAASSYGGTAIKIEHTAALCLDYRDRRLVRIGGGTRLTGFQRGVHLRDVNRPLLNSVQIAGHKIPEQYQPGSVGVLIEGTAQPVLTEIVNPHVRHTETGVWLLGAMEGVSVSRARMPSVRRGVLAEWSSQNPDLTVTDSHINARDRCVKATNVSEGKFSGNNFYRYPNVAGPGAWAAIELISADRCTISGNTMSGNPAAGDPAKAKTTPSYAIKLGANVMRSQAYGNTGYGIDAGVLGAGGLTETSNAWDTL